MPDSHLHANTTQVALTWSLWGQLRAHVVSAHPALRSLWTHEYEFRKYSKIMGLQAKRSVTQNRPSVSLEVVAEEDIKSTAMELRSVSKP